MTRPKTTTRDPRTYRLDRDVPERGRDAGGCLASWTARSLLVLGILLAATPALAGIPMSSGLVEHRGFEHLIAGPDVPDVDGLPTDADYESRRVALGEDGSRIWFTMFNQYNEAKPEYLVVTMLTDGTDARVVDITPDEDYLEGRTIYLEVSAAADRAVFHTSTFNSPLNTGENWFATATLPPGAGSPVAELFAYVTDMRRTINEAFRVTDDGATILVADVRNQIVGSFETTGRGVATLPTVLADRTDLARFGNEPSSLNDFDMTGTGAEWWTFAYDFYDSQERYWLNHGQGAGVSHEILPLGDELWSDWLEVSDDGDVLVYCLEYDFESNDPQGCWIQEPGMSSWTRILGDRGHLGQPVLADGGGVVYVTDEWTQGTSYGYRVSTANPSSRRVAGTQWFTGGSRPEFDLVRLSDDGRVLAAPVEDGIYVQHDGVPAPAGFPSLSSFASGYDASEDELVVRVTVDPSSAPLDRIYTLPLYRGIEPSRILPEEENPLLWDANGGGINASTTFDQVGMSDTWERRIPMGGKHGLLTSDFAIRIVAVDLLGHRTSYVDFVPSVLFADGFESGDTTGWTN